MADIFISYSHRDDVFARKLHDRLTRMKHDVWMDWEDIPFNSDWWDEIKRGIETSDNFLIILTNNFVASPVSMLEVEYARQNNKRILVVAHQFEESEQSTETLSQRASESETVQQLLGDREIVGIFRENWTTIGHVNWQFFNDDTAFEVDFRKLIETLETDLNHVRNHTNLQVRSLEWFTNDRNWSFLMTGLQIDQAEKWLYAADTESKVPLPTFVQREFIKASRTQQEEQEKNIDDMQMRAKRFRQASIIAGVIAAIMIVVAIGLTVFTSIQASDARNQIADANAQAMEAGETLTSIPPTFEAIQVQIDDNNTQVAAVGETLTPIGATLAFAESEREQAQSLADNAQTQVIEANSALNAANDSLTPVAVTLTQSANEQAAASTLVAEANSNFATANVDSITAEALLDSAETQVAGANAALSEANATLSPIAPTLTQASNQIADANAASTNSAAQLATATVQIAAASSQVANVNIQVTNANAVLTQVVPTLTEASDLVVDAETQVADAVVLVGVAGTKVADVDNQIATADAQNLNLASTADAIQLTSEANAVQAQSQSLVVNAEQVALNGDIDLALALLIESYRLDPNLPQTRRLLNDIAYTSARFIMSDTTFANFSSDSQLVAYGLGNEVVIVDIMSRTEITRLDAHTDLVIAGEFNFRGDLFISGSADSTVIVWDTATWTIIETLTNHEAPITDVAFDNQGNQIGAVADNSTAIVWNIRENYTATVFNFNNPDTRLHTIEFVANGTRFLAWGLSGLNEVMYRANIETGQFARIIDQIYTTLNPAYDVNAGHVVRQAMIDTESFLAIYDVVNPSSVLNFGVGFNWVQGEDRVGVRAFNSNGSEVIVSLENVREGRNELIRFNTGQRERASGFEFDGEAARRVTALAFSPDGRTILSGFGRYLVLWDYETGRELRRFGAHLDDIVAITYSLDSNHAITRSRDGNYRVWDVSYSDSAVIGQISVSSGSGAAATNPGISPDNSEIYFNLASDIYRFDAERRVQNQPAFSFFNLQDIIYNRFNTYVVTTAEDTVRGDSQAHMYDISAQPPSLWNESVRGDNNEVIDPIGAFSSDGQQIALSMATFVQVYDVTTTFAPERDFQLDRRGMDISALVFSPAGDILYAATNMLEGEEAYAIVAWNLNTEEQRIIPIPHIRTITSIDISEDGTQIITASEDQTLVLFDLVNNVLLRRMVGHRGTVNEVYFGQDDLVALSASDDGSLILWDLVTGQSIRRYLTSNPISGLYLSNDNTLAVSTDGTAFVTIWQIETLDDVIAWVLANREIPTLSPEQCLQYNIDCSN